MEPIARIDREDGVKAVKFLQIVANSIQMAERKMAAQRVMKVHGCCSIAGRRCRDILKTIHRNSKGLNEFLSNQKL
jgi:hypothetical protein